MKFLLFFSFLLTFSSSQSYDSLDVIEKYGYKGERHEAATSDGYFLEVHRVRAEKSTKLTENSTKLPKNSTKLPIFLMHGLFESSIEFLQLQHDSLAFVLADSGFDVFLGNSRRNQYARHAEYSKNSSEFWDFSFHEIGIFDLPSMIDCVLNITKAEKLFYIGLSQGTTAVLAMLSVLPEYNEKIAQLHLLAPAVFMSHLPNPLLRNHGRLILDTLFPTGNLINLTSIADFFKPLLRRTCYKSGIFRQIPCLFVEYSIVGGNVEKVETDFEALSNFLDVVTPLVSRRQLLHYLQLKDSNEFQFYDFGEEKNLKVYGSGKVPKYELKNVKAPVYIFYGGQDGLVDPRGVQRLEKELPNVIYSRLIRNFNHFNFEGSRNAKKEVYVKILDFLNKENSVSSKRNLKERVGAIRRIFDVLG